jgi:hypothetical protein
MDPTLVVPYSSLSGLPRRGRLAARVVSNLLLVILCLGSASSLRADAFLEESHELAAGWNLIHVGVEPSVKDPVAALVSVAWQSIWTWLPSESEPRGGRWLVLYKDAPAFLNTLSQPAGTSPLFSFTGPSSYFIFTSSSGTLRVKGAVRSGRAALRGERYQLFGPSFDTASPPSLSGYFSRPGVKEHIGSVFELVGPSYRRVLASDILRPSAGYWVFPERDIPAPDPLRVQAGLGGLRFDAQTTLQELSVDIGAIAPSDGGGGVVQRQFVLRTVPSAGGAATTDWLELQKADGTFAAPGTGVTIDVAPDQSMLRLTLRSQSEGLAAQGSGDQAAVVELVSSAGRVSVGADLEVPGLRGVWRGEANIAEVERPSFLGGGFAPAPTLSMALLLEFPPQGPPRLLHCAAIESTRDGRNVTYRLEAALFHKTVTLTGTVGQEGDSGSLQGTILLPADHPLNPYRHRYHPEHPVGYELTRTLKMSFGAGSPGGDAVNPFTAVGVLSGVYEEEIHGLAQGPIHIRGTFRMHRITGGAASACPEAGQ